MVFGPTGSGKELVARKIHKNSLRSKEPFVILNAAYLRSSFIYVVIKPVFYSNQLSID